MRALKYRVIIESTVLKLGVNIPNGLFSRERFSRRLRIFILTRKPALLTDSVGIEIFIRKFRARLTLTQGLKLTGKILLLEIFLMFCKLLISLTHARLGSRVLTQLISGFGKVRVSLCAKLGGGGCLAGRPIYIRVAVHPKTVSGWE